MLFVYIPGGTVVDTCTCTHYVRARAGATQSLYGPGSCTEGRVLVCTLCGQLGGTCTVEDPPDSALSSGWGVRVPLEVSTDRPRVRTPSGWYG